MRTITRRANPRGGVVWNARSLARSLASVRARARAEEPKEVDEGWLAGSVQAQGRSARTEDDELARRQAASVAWQRPHLASLSHRAQRHTLPRTHAHIAHTIHPCAFSLQRTYTRIRAYVHTTYMHYTACAYVMIFSFSLACSLSFSLPRSRSFLPPSPSLIVVVAVVVCADIDRAGWCREPPPTPPTSPFARPKGTRTHRAEKPVSIAKQGNSPDEGREGRVRGREGEERTCLCMGHRCVQGQSSGRYRLDWTVYVRSRYTEDGQTGVVIDRFWLRSI